MLIFKSGRPFSIKKNQCKTIFPPIQKSIHLCTSKIYNTYMGWNLLPNVCADSRSCLCSIICLQARLVTYDTVTPVTWSGHWRLNHFSNQAMTKANLQVAGDWLWFNLKRDGFCQVYLPKLYVNEYLSSFQPRHMEETKVHGKTCNNNLNYDHYMNERVKEGFWGFFVSFHPKQQGNKATKPQGVTECKRMWKRKIGEERMKFFINYVRDLII